MVISGSLSLEEYFLIEIHLVIVYANSYISEDNSTHTVMLLVREMGQRKHETVASKTSPTPTLFFPYPKGRKGKREIYGVSSGLLP